MAIGIGNVLDRRDVAKIVASGAFFVLIGMFLDRGLGYLTRIILARSFSVEEYGMFFLALSVLKLFISFSIFNMHIAATRYISYFRGKGDNNRVKGAILSSFKIAIPASLVAFSILFIFSEPISVYVFHEPALAPLLTGLSFILLFVAIARVCVASTQAFNTIKYDVYSRNIGKTVSTLVVLVVFLWLGFGLTGAMFAYLIGYVVMFFLGFHFLRKLFPIFSPDIKEVPMKKKFFSFAWPLVLTGIIWNFNAELSTLALGILRNTTEVGIFESAIPSTAFLMVMPACVMTLFMPLATQMLSKGRTESIKKLSKKMFKWMFYLNFPILLVLFFYSEPIINILFGAKYLAAGAVLRILSIGFFINAMSVIGIHILYAYEKTLIQLPNSIIIIIVNFSLNFLLIPIYGAVGAAISMTLMYAVLSVLYFVEAYKFSGISPFNKKIYKSVIAGVIASLFIFTMNYFIQQFSLMIIILILVVYIIIYVIVLLILGGIEKDDMIIFDLIEKKSGFRSKKIMGIINRFVE
jgi:O-antigen/teichoic acid export membrane protein